MPMIVEELKELEKKIHEDAIKESIPIKLMASFLENAHLFTPEQRGQILNIIEYHSIPKHIVSHKSPIEEDWLKKQNEEWQKKQNEKITSVGPEEK